MNLAGLFPSRNKMCQNKDDSLFQAWYNGVIEILAFFASPCLIIFSPRNFIVTEKNLCLTLLALEMFTPLTTYDNNISNMICNTLMRVWRWIGASGIFSPHLTQIRLDQPLHTWVFHEYLLILLHGRVDGKFLKRLHL